MSHNASLEFRLCSEWNAYEEWAKKKLSPTLKKVAQECPNRETCLKLGNYTIAKGCKGCFWLYNNFVRKEKVDFI